MFPYFHWTSFTNAQVEPAWLWYFSILIQHCRSLFLRHQIERAEWSFSSWQFFKKTLVWRPIHHIEGHFQELFADAGGRRVSAAAKNVFIWIPSWPPMQQLFTLQRFTNFFSCQRFKVWSNGFWGFNNRTLFINFLPTYLILHLTQRWRCNEKIL